MFWFFREFMVFLNLFVIKSPLMFKIMKYSPYLKCSSLLKASEVENTAVSDSSQQMSFCLFT
jgi:hypothetical protein